MTGRSATRIIVRGRGGRGFNIAVTGTLDRQVASSLRYFLHELEHDDVTIDLTECIDVAEGAFESLLAAAEMSKRRGGALHLRCPSATA